MKKCLKSTLSILLAAVLLLTIVPFGASAAETAKLTFTASSKNAVPGETVDVDIVMTNNPGIASIGLNVGYDSDILTIENITFNSAMGGTTQTSQLTKNPAKIIWINSTENFNGDATVATITFKVKSDITDNIATDVELTYDPDDIYNIAEDNIDCDIVNGVVNVVAAVPGDINGDTKVNNKDVTRLMQYLAHWDVFVNVPTLDTNGDGKVNNKDVTRLMQYLAHWDVEIHVGSQSSTACEHQLTKIDAVAAECEKDGNTTYWHCEKCGKYYADANAVREIKLEDTVVEATGHTPEVIPAVPATYESEGSTEGSRCSVCGKVLVEPQPVPITQKDAYSITYHLYDGDTYLQEVGATIVNPNLNYYSTQDGYIAPDGGNKLKDATVDGFKFEGWYDSEGSSGELVRSIPAGSKGNYDLYARWSLRDYKITFHSPLVPVDPIYYHVNTGATLKNPSLNGYNFIGWCDENDKLVTSIPVGTTGNMTLYANWTSKRNQTRPVSRLDDPIILEDADKGSILFAYEIGTVENVPIQALSKTYQSVGGMKQTYTTSESVNVTSSEAKNIAKTVSNTTSESKAWTLSENWNDVTSVSESYAKQKGLTKEEAEQRSKTSSNTYSINSSSGGSQTNTTSNGLSGTVSKSNSSTEGGSVTHERETGSEFEVNGKMYYEGGANTNIGIDKIASVGASMKAGWEVGASYSNYDKNKDSVSMNYSNTGTDASSLTGQSSSASSGTATWNSSSGYSSSSSTSQTNSVRNVLSEVVSETKNYGSSYSRGGNKSDTQSFTNSSAESNQYSSAITFSEGTTTTQTKTIELGGENEGYYRFVLAGKAHVFAVVGYDVATSSYYVFTYTVMDDETYTFIDYSKDTASFDDNENGVLPFEVPYFVKEYVDARIMQTEGLSVNQEGFITGYNGTDDIVYIPSYYRMDNRDGTYSSVKITGITSDAFAGKNIKAISLSNYITEIPNNAFKNCSKLNVILCPGVTKIKAHAFDGCSSLRDFKVNSEIEELGEKAFNGVKKLSVDASTTSVAIGAINSGVKQIVLNISANPAAMEGSEFIVPDSISSFELRGNAAEYKDIKVKSDAAKTVLNGLTITSTNGIPLDISSENVVFNRVNVNSTGFAAVLKNNKTNIGLYGSVKMNSENGKAIVCKNIALSEVDSTISSSLNVTGNIYICGNISGQNYLTITNGNIITITDDEFEKYAKGCYQVAFNANGGKVGTEQKTVYYGSEFGELPVPSRDYYNFDGWFTDSKNGEKIESNTIFDKNNDITLYAHWTLKPVKGWVEANQMPDDAQLVNSKWSYTEREYTTNGASSLSGWTKYDTKVTDHGSTQGPVYSDPTGNNRQVWTEQYVASTTTHYKYWRYVNPAGDHMSNSGNGAYYGCTIYQEIDLTYPLSWMSNDGNFDYYGEYVYNGNTYLRKRWFSGGTYVTNNYATCWYYRDPIYTYYYYRDVNKEATSDPTGTQNVSNIKKWVQYREK